MVSDTLFNRFLELCKGESGSLVVDTGSLAMYGHVVALSPINEVYVSPLTATLKQVRQAYSGSTVSLPDPETTLSDLMLSLDNATKRHFSSLLEHTRALKQKPDSTRHPRK